MQTKHAIIAFSQSEKVKSGLIWCSNFAHIAQNLPPQEQRGAITLLGNLVAFLLNEVQLARQASGETIWLEVEKILNKARVLIESGVGQETTHHFTQALSQTNRIGQKAMTDLIDKGLISPSLLTRG